MKTLQDFWYIYVKANNQEKILLKPSTDLEQHLIKKEKCARMMGREKYGKGKEVLMIQNIPLLFMGLYGC